MEKIVLGLIELVEINGKEFKAKIDTGADHSAMCHSAIEELHLKPTGNVKRVRSATGREKRQTYHAELSLRGRVFNVELSAAKREHLSYKVLIGRDILKKGFIIDPQK